MTSKPRLVRCPRCRNILPEPTDVLVYKCGGCGATLQVKKRNNSSVDTTSQRPDDDSSAKRKVDQVFGDPEAGGSSKHHLQPNFTDESNQNSDYDDLHGSKKAQDAANKAKNGSVDAPSGAAEEYAYEKQKLKRLCDDHEASSSSNQQPLANSIHNDPRSSTELSGHEDPESSPEATGHNRIDQDAAGKKPADDATNDDNDTSSTLNQPLVVNSINNLDQKCDHNEPRNSSELSYHEDPESSPEATADNRIDEEEEEEEDYNDQVFLSCRREIEFEESGSEFEETFAANTRTGRVSDCNPKSSFKSLIAEKLLDARQKKAVDLDEGDTLSEDRSADLHHPRRFDRFNGKSYYEYEGSESSFDGNGRKHFDSGNRNLFNPLYRRFGKDEHRSFYGLNPKHRSHLISGNPKEERIELLKIVQQLQNQIERTSISNPPQQLPLFNHHVFNNPRRYDRRMAFSGETTAVNTGSTCHHCCPRDRHFSAQLPTQQLCCNGPHYGSIPYYSPRISGPSSPIHNRSESEFSAPDDFRYQNYDVNKQYRSPKKKRYVRPIAGGSPWIACYRCLKLIELPQSVFVFSKRYHSLKCGACMKVLNFTLSDGTHVSRYYPEETMAAPPSSEVEDYDGLNGSRARQVSCSDSSFQKSYSTETDRNGSWEFGEERGKATMARDPSGSTQQSSRRKMTLEGKVGPRLNGSPLHRLMGYASPSKVIRG